MLKTKTSPIKSAEAVAALRAYTSKDPQEEVQCPDYLAKNFIGLKYRMLTLIKPQSLLKNLVNYRLPGSYGFAIARTKHFDRILLSEIAKGVQQVVFLGAGYDTRAFRFEEKLKSVKVFEVDFPGTQLYKRKVLSKVIPNIPSNIKYVPLDFNKQSFEQELEKAGFSRDRKTLFLWEGVSYYLPKDVVVDVLNFAGSCAPRSSILFDYATRDFVHGDYSTYGAEGVAALLKKLGEPFIFGLNLHETKPFLGRCNLKIVSDLGPEEQEKLYLKNREGKLISRTFGHLRMLHARVW